MLKKKYLVCGHTSVAVVVEVFADSESEALEKASEQCPCLTPFCGNGGTDKLVGVNESTETVAIEDEITYDEAWCCGTFECDGEDEDEDEFDDEE